MEKRILFKIRGLVFKCLNELAPDYLTSKCIRVANQQFHEHLRSASQNALFVPCSNLRSAERDFDVAGPRF